MSRNAGLTADTLFVAVTRPTMYLGVTAGGFVGNVMLTMEVVAFTGNILWMAMFVPIHGLFVLLCMYEPRVFDLVQSWARTANATSYRPYRLDLPNRKGLRRHSAVEVVL